jgi:hypothetical protein
MPFLSFGLYTRLACQRRPFWNLGGNIGGKVGRTVTDDLGALLAQSIADIRQS